MPGSIDLLDASVWLALAAKDHAHHTSALQYWQDDRADQVAFCRVTALAFMRLQMNPAVMRYGVITADQAWSQYQQWRQVPGVIFLAEHSDLEATLGQVFQSAAFGYREVTDAYLASFAKSTRCRFVSFDKGFSRYKDLNFLPLSA